jgi:plasmid stability protein
MASITIRDLPDSVLEKVRMLSKRNRRSMNSELLTLIEEGIEKKQEARETKNGVITSETQAELWQTIAGDWEDSRSTEQIIKDIYDTRTEGRTVTL